MNLTILGKYGPYGKAGTGAASGYLVEDGDFKMLLDMGSGVLCRLLQSTDIQSLDGIYFSHFHYDHTSDFLGFRYLLEELGTPITVYTHYEDSEWYRLLFLHPLLHIVHISDGDILQIKHAELSFYKMNHPVENLAVKIRANGKTLLYTGDTAFTEKIYEVGKGCDVILADCSKPVGFVGGHMTVDYAENIQKATCAKVIATHQSPDYDPSDYVKGITGVVSAEEGRTYKI